MPAGLPLRCARCAIADPDALGLTPPERLALVYAPTHARAAWAGLLALEHRLGDVTRAAREPIMAQLRLAWWRERLNEPAAARPKGEPLLGALAAWDGERRALVALVDAHEAALLGQGADPLRAARAEALCALARLAGSAWSAEAALAWLAAEPGTPRPPRALRPLLVLRHFDQHADAAPWRLLLGAMRKGLLGR